ncbi:hypothetical protein DIPPA_15590 [Diplonema papillatum]|nr:hypothetical protein DIPPA_15590 [Diplonema papillatum]
MAEGGYSLRRKAAETDRTLRQEAVRRAKQKAGGDNLLFVRATADAAAVWFDAAARLPAPAFGAPVLLKAWAKLKTQTSCNFKMENVGFLEGWKALL